VLFTGATPQSAIFEGLDRLKGVALFQHAACSEKELKGGGSGAGVARKTSIKPSGGVTSSAKPIPSPSTAKPEPVKSAASAKSEVIAHSKPTSAANKTESGHAKLPTAAKSSASAQPSKSTDAKKPAGGRKDNDKVEIKAPHTPKGAKSSSVDHKSASKAATTASVEENKPVSPAGSDPVASTPPEEIIDVASVELVESSPPLPASDLSPPPSNEIVAQTGSAVDQSQLGQAFTFDQGEDDLLRYQTSTGDLLSAEVQSVPDPTPLNHGDNGASYSEQLMEQEQLQHREEEQRLIEEAQVERERVLFEQEQALQEQEQALQQQKQALQEQDLQDQALQKQALQEQALAVERQLEQTPADGQAQAVGEEENEQSKIVEQHNEPAGVADQMHEEPEFVEEHHQQAGVAEQKHEQAGFTEQNLEKTGAVVPKHEPSHDIEDHVNDPIDLLGGDQVDPDSCYPEDIHEHVPASQENRGFAGTPDEPEPDTCYPDVVLPDFLRVSTANGSAAGVGISDREEELSERGMFDRMDPDGLPDPVETQQPLSSMIRLAAVGGEEEGLLIRQDSLEELGVIGATGDGDQSPHEPVSNVASIIPSEGVPSFDIASLKGNAGDALGFEGPNPFVGIGGDQVLSPTALVGSGEFEQLHAKQAVHSEDYQPQGVGAGYVLKVSAHSDVVSDDLDRDSLEREVADGQGVGEFDPLSQWGQPMNLPAPNKLPGKDDGDKAKANESIRKPPAALGKKPRPAGAAAEPAALGTARHNESSSAKPSSARAAQPIKKPMTAPASKPAGIPLKPVVPFYVDLAYVPGHGGSQYADFEFFRRVRARYYVLSTISADPATLTALLDAKATWEGGADAEAEVTIIPTYDAEVLRYFMHAHRERMSQSKIDVAPAANRCSIQLQDHGTGAAAYRLEF